jgi:MoxR-like ATPase
MEMTLKELRDNFLRVGYICDDEVVLTVFLALKLNKPILIEGPPGVGKTEMGKVLAEIFETELIRLQCYEGLDENKALYEWNYQRQLLKIQISKESGSREDLESDLFSPEYLLMRPLLKAISSEKRQVLLIDEVDKCDEEFEAFLFEVLSDFQVSVPELGTIKAKEIPMVVLTSNNERELSDGLKRRCVFLYLDYPQLEREIAIIRARIPGIEEKLTAQVARAVKALRDNPDIKKKPSIAETLDWTRALVTLNADRLDPKVISQTMNLLLKSKADLDAFGQRMGAGSLSELAVSP